MRTFYLSEKEQNLADEWYEIHSKKCLKPSTDTLTGLKYITVSYEFFPTGIGEVAVIKCQNCKSEKNITDYDSW